MKSWTLVVLTGMSSRALSGEVSELEELVLPCILHWDLDHFVVLTRVNKNSFQINDPANGQRILSYNEIDNHFTGVALELTPTSEFKEER